MTLIMLARHGQTAWNRQRIFRGRTDVPLTETGVQQARALARRVAEERPAAVYCSPLARALVTAQAAGEEAGLSPETLDDLTDMSFGAWEGQSHERVQARDPVLYAQWVTEPHTVRPPEGETLAEVRRRATGALHLIAGRHRDAVVAVVAHRVVNKLLVCAALGLGDEAFWRIRQDTGCLNILEWGSAGAGVVLLNDTCHLRGLEKDSSDF